MVENINYRSNNKPPVIILAGAGASVQLGYPTLDDLMQQAVIGNDQIADLIRDVRNSINVKKYMTAVFEEMIVKIKDNIRIAEMLRNDYVLKKEIGQISNDVSTGRVEIKFKEALVRCYQVLVESYGPDIINKGGREFDFTISLFRSLATITGELDIYTTNYDCTYQVLGSRCSDLCFRSHISNQDGNFQELAWYNINKDIKDNNISKIYVHRLHGCIAWFNNIDDEGGSGFINERFGAGGDLQVPIEQLSSMCIKLITSQLIGTNRAFASAFDEFNQHLTTIKKLIVWGYSFRDLEVTRQINQALFSRREPFEIYYIDPFLTEYAARNNIVMTLRNAPIQISDKFIPKQIKWTPSDGLNDLINKVLNIVNEGGGECQ